MSVLAYQKHDVVCDRVVDGKICDNYFEGEVGHPAFQVRVQAQIAGWVFFQNPGILGVDRDYCPEHIQEL